MSNNPWNLMQFNNADEFLKYIITLGKPSEVSIVGAYSKQGRGSTQDMDLPLHFDGDYSARKAAEKGLPFEKKIDIVALYCIKANLDTITSLEWVEVENKTTSSIDLNLKEGQALIIDNKLCKHGRKGSVGDRLLLRVWIEK